MNNFTLGLALGIAMWGPLPGLASDEIYQYVDANGVLTLTNIGAAGARRPVSGHPWEQQVEHAARVHAIDPRLLYAMIDVESGSRQAAVSPKGAIGLMQVMPETGRRFGAGDLFNPAQNIDAGSRYLRVLAAMFDNDLALVLAAYNAGENAVARFGNRIPPYPETKQYVERVIERYRRSQPPHALR